MRTRSSSRRHRRFVRDNQTVPADFRMEQLEKRVLLAANLSIRDAYLSGSSVNADGTEGYEAAPGELIRVRVQYEAVGLEPEQTFVIQITVNGISLRSEPQTVPTDSGVVTYQDRGWPALPGTHTVDIQIDVDDDVPEDNEADNAFSFEFTTASSPDIAEKFVYPMAHLQPWAGGVDVDPRQDHHIDFEGLGQGYDGHNGWDRSDFEKWYEMDRGIPLFAAASGTVVSVSDGRLDRTPVTQNVGGNGVTIDHGNGWHTRYGHNAANSMPLEAGDRIRAGQFLGLMGSSGNSSAVHIHFVVERNGNPVETGYALSEYWDDAIISRGDRVAELTHSYVGYTGWLGDSIEWPEEKHIFSKTLGEDVFYNYRFHGVQSSSVVEIVWVGPNGEEIRQSSSKGRSRKSKLLNTAQMSEGLWMVQLQIDGVIFASEQFEVRNDYRQAAIKVREQSTAQLVPYRRSSVYWFPDATVGSPDAFQEFTIENHGTEDLFLSNLELPEGFELHGAFPVNVAPGEASPFVIAMPYRDNAFKLGEVQFDTNDPYFPKMQFTVGGSVLGISSDPRQPDMLLDSREHVYVFETAEPTRIDPLATFSANDAHIPGSILSVDFAANGIANDQLLLPGNDVIDLSGAHVRVDGVQIATVAGGANGSSLRITFNHQASETDVQEILRNIAFQTTSAPRATAIRRLRIWFEDATGNTNQTLQVKPVIATHGLGAIFDFDFGDAPNSYGTSIAANGPRHQESDLRLGLQKDSDRDGYSSPLADRDDGIGEVNDEDGIRFIDPFIPGENSRIEVTASGPGHLRFWVDFNADGTFGANEGFAHIFSDAGTSQVTVPVPAGAIPGKTFARFRLSTDSGAIATPLGAAPDGEVEDYAVVVTTGQFVVTTSNDDGDGSLRQAIELAGLSPGTDTISFAIASGAQTISPATPLPDITSPIIIDGTTQPGWVDSPIVELTGLPNGLPNGLVLRNHSESIVRGLVINGFSSSGVMIEGGGAHRIEQSYIGTNASGTSAVANTMSGVVISNSEGNFIGTNGDGQNDEDEGNLISGNDRSAVDIRSAHNNIIAGNYIGTDPTGDVAVPNSGSGTSGSITIGGGSTGNVIGTTGDSVSDSIERNLISGNATRGIRISGLGTEENRVAGNWIGVNAAGDAALSNTDGVRTIDNASRNIVGTNGDGHGDAAERNIISGNTHAAVHVTTDENWIAGNWIGTDSTGARAIPNEGTSRFGAVAIDGGASGNLVGSDGDGVSDEIERNVISGNSTRGVRIAGVGTNETQVSGNFIGVDVTGMNPLPNNGHGIGVLAGTSNTLIGTNRDGLSDEVEANVISANNNDGVAISGNSSNMADAVVDGNFIGTDVTGVLDLGNRNHGLDLRNGADSVSITQNIIAHNGGVGVAITNDNSIRNTVSRNSIFNNGNLGIDLAPGGRTANDALDSDVGPNGILNHPTLTSAEYRPGELAVAGTLESLPNHDFKIEFFINTSAGPNGEHFAGTVDVSSSADGIAAFNAVLNVDIGESLFVTATTTDSDGNTSEFSQEVTIVELPVLTLNLASRFLVENGGVTTATIHRTGDTSLPLAITLVSSDPGELRVPTSVIIPAGHFSSSPFVLTGVDDDFIDGSQAVKITATAPGMIAAEAFVQVVDDELTTVDLRSTSFDAAIDHVLGGQTNITFTLQNTGNVASGSFRTQVIWSLNPILGDSDDVALAGSELVFGPLQPQSSIQRSQTLQIDQNLLYQHALLSDAPGEKAGTVSRDTSRLFLLVDSRNEVSESNESNNAGRGHHIDSDDITYFPWDSNRLGTVTPLTALQSILAIGTGNSNFDYNGDGVVTPLEALSTLQRIGYARNTLVDESFVVTSLASLQPTNEMRDWPRDLFLPSDEYDSYAEQFSREPDDAVHTDIYFGQSTEWLDVVG